MTGLIVNNPYRILGVLVNSSLKERLTNVNRFKAFNKVGKSVETDVDFNEVMGVSPNRSIDSIEGAMHALTLPIDQLKHALFWVASSIPADEIALKNLAVGKIEKALSIEKKFAGWSSFLNYHTLSLLAQDLKGAIIAFTGLITYQKHQLLTGLGLNTLDLSEEEFVDIYYNQISIEFSTKEILLALKHSPYKNNKIYDIFVKRISNDFIEKINHLISIAKDTPQNDSKANLKAGIDLKTTSLPILLELRGLPNNKANYQIIADKVALQVLQNSIYYYNESNDDEAPRIALPLIEFAKEIAIGQVAKERCNDNYDILRKAFDKLPPQSVIYYHKLLKILIDEHKSKRYTIENAYTFVDKCFPYLMSIKTVLGPSSSYYQDMCTRVAEEALEDIIVDYNKRSESFQNLLEKTANSLFENRIIKLIQDMMKSAVIAMYHIKKLGLNSEFRKNRFNKNYDIIVEQARNARAFSSKRIYGILSEKDFNNELKKYEPDLRDEEDYFSTIVNLQGCYDYNKTFPGGKFAKQVNNKIEEYEYEECSTLDDVMKFKEKYPSSKFDIEKKREEIIFNSCKTIDDYTLYLSRYNTYKVQAITRIDDLRFKECKKREDYEQYLKLYPTGIHRSDAERKLDELDYMSCSSLQDFERYVQNHPSGSRLADAQKWIADEKAWKMCIKTDSWKAYKEYLSKFPSGRHSREAKPKALSPSERLKKWIENNGCLFSFFIVVTIILLIAGITKGVLGIGYVFGMVAACGVFGSMGKGEIGCGPRIAMLGVGIITGFIAFGLISWGEVLERENKAKYAVNQLSHTPSFADYHTLFSQYGNEIENSTKQKLLDQYYNITLDSCYSTIHDYQDRDYNSTFSGLGYLKKFAETCHDVSYKDQAEEKYSYIVDSLYTAANDLNTYDAWNAYQESVPSDDYRDSQDKKDAADTRWSTDNSAWKTASSVNSITSYQKYLDLYPYGKYKSTAESKLIDLQVDATFAGEHGYLPEMDKTSYGGGSTSAISVYNNTSYTLTLLYSGKESKKLVLAPNSRGSLRLKNGTYRIAASVSASNVQRYAGSETLNGGGYEVEYYISTSTVPSY